MDIDAAPSGAKNTSPADAALLRRARTTTRWLPARQVPDANWPEMVRCQRLCVRGRRPWTRHQVGLL